MATIRVSKDGATVPKEKDIKFYVGSDKMEQKLLSSDPSDTIITLDVTAGKNLEFKACFCGSWTEEPTKVEPFMLAPGTFIHYEVFCDKNRLRLREINSSDSGSNGETGIRIVPSDVGSYIFPPRYALWLDGQRHNKRLCRDEVFIPVTPDSGKVTHTFRASLFPDHTHTYYAKLSEPGHQLTYHVWSGAKRLFIARRVGYKKEENCDSSEGQKAE